MALTASAFFVWQGGFGGGHGTFDRVIGALGLPGILLTTALPVQMGDVVAILLLPAAVNLVLWVAVATIIRKLRLRRAV